jgi:hypothetical protein
MANQNQLDILERGPDVWNRWRKEHRNVVPDLRGAVLEDVSLMEYDLNRVDLSGAHLGAAGFMEVDLSRANLSKADLVGAYLMDANLRGANLRGADLENADLSRADLTAVDFTGANLEQAHLVEATLTDANLDGCRIYGISAWELKVANMTQKNLVITPRGRPIITVDNLEVAQFIYLLLNNAKVRSVIDTITTKVVLILGRFTPTRKAILDAIRDALRESNYLPVLFDFDKPATRDTTETITTLARLARFIIADITLPKSIPQELVSIVEALPSVPVQPLLQGKRRPWGMYDHIRRYPWVLELHRYNDLSDLLPSLQAKVIEPAEAKAREQQPR